MKRKKLPGHYCRICGRRRPNEKFSGKGHATHICKDCAKMPVEQRNEIQTVNRIYSLPFRLKKDQKKWLEEQKESKSEAIREAAEYAYDERFGRIDDGSYLDIDEFETDDGFYLDEEDDEWNPPTFELGDELARDLPFK